MGCVFAALVREGFAGAQLWRWSGHGQGSDRAAKPCAITLVYKLPNGRLLQRLESDPLEMSKYLLSFSSRSEIIQIDQEEYSEMLHELNDIRSRYACSAREAIATTKKAIEDLVKKPIKKVERAFTCLQDANPAVPDGADLGFIDKDEPQLPIIAFVQHPWELL